MVRWLLHSLALPYGLVTRVRNTLYDWEWLPRHRLPCRVISIGNLTVGGTGKTPMVIWVVEQLLRHGARVGVLSRGYRRKSRARYLLVSDGQRLLASATEAGDEPVLIARRCPEAVVAVGADRAALGRWVLDQFPLDCLVLDDGFQHRAVHRDVDLLLIDATDVAGLQALLPAGRLREPLSSAARASAILVTRSHAPADLGRVVAPIARSIGRPVDPILVRFAEDAYVDLSSGVTQDLTQVAGRTAVIFSGIANPEGFRASVAQCRVVICEELVFPDHHDYSNRDVERIRHCAGQLSADLVLTTEKDAVKVVPSWGSDRPVWAVRLRTDVVCGRERLEDLVLGGARADGSPRGRP